MPTKLEDRDESTLGSDDSEVMDFWGPMIEGRHSGNSLESQIAERELRMLANIARETRDSVIITDQNLMIRWVNAAASQMSGYASFEMLGRNLLEIAKSFTLSPDTANALLQQLETGNRLATRAWTVKKNGEPLLAEFEMLPYRNEHGKLVALIGITKDLTAQETTERTLRETAEHLLDAQELAKVGSWRYFVDTREIRWSSQLFQAYGRDPSLAAPTMDEFLNYIEPQYQQVVLELIRNTVANGTPYEATFVVKRADGTRVHLYARAKVRRDNSGRVVEIYGTTQDITSRVQAEREHLELQARVASTQRLESLGLLAGGVAHDFNNLLMGVMMDASLLEREVHPNTQAFEAIANIREAASRMADLTSQLLAYSGRGRFVTERIDPNRLVADVFESFVHDVPRTVTTESQINDAAILVEIDPSQLRLVTSNLLANARDALGDRPGRITLKTRSETTNTRSGGWVLEIIDTGAGMTEEVQRRIFEPFFSTKPSGRGLGLSTVHGLVQRGRGTIDVQSVPSLGTSMTIRLPTIEVVTKPAANPVEPTSPPRPLRILIADDEAMVRRSLRRMLELNRTQVVEVGDGATALEVLISDGPPFDLALLDMVMPKMTGQDVLVEIRNRNIPTKVVLMSGYNDLDTDRDPTQRTHEADARLQKPFAWDELKRVMNSLINSRVPSFGDH